VIRCVGDDERVDAEDEAEAWIHAFGRWVGAAFILVLALLIVLATR